MTATAETITPHQKWLETAHALGRTFAERQEKENDSDRFVEANYADLKAAKFFSAQVPAEFGGGGLSFAGTCDVLRVLGSYCGSTALAFSMHNHILAGVLWRWRSQKAPVENLLKRIAAEELVFVSSGGSDWLNGSGTAEKVDGGYRIKARKIFASGSPSGDILMTMAVATDGGTPAVLHFPLPMRQPGVKILDTWQVMGMRGTGSHDIDVDGPVVPDAAVAVRRPVGKWHPSMHVVTLVAIPLIYSAYLGVAEGARAIALRECARRRELPDVPALVGDMENHWTAARLAWNALVERGAGGAPGEETSSFIMSLRTLLAQSAIATVEKAMEAVGGRSFYRSLGLERRFRDIQAARFHPLTFKPQTRLTGRVALGLPIDE